jgi:hypothetical protein
MSLQTKSLLAFGQKAFDGGPEVAERPGIGYRSIKPRIANQVSRR